MSNKTPLLLTASLWAGILISAEAQTKLPTVQEAMETSRKTGRPIFAMAGRKT